MRLRGNRRAAISLKMSEVPANLTPRISTTFDALWRAVGVAVLSADRHWPDSARLARRRASGFSAGVVIGLGVALWYVVFGYHETKERLPWLRPRRFISIGLALAFT